MFKVHNIDAEMLSVEPSNFGIMAFFVNAIILSANVLNAHKLVQDNQALIKQLLLNILKQDTAHASHEDNGCGAARSSYEGDNQFGSMQESVPASSTSLPSKERS